MNKNNKQLESFTKYCIENPEQRFFQALRNWAKVPFVLFSDGINPLLKVRDTFYFEDEESK